ncbi:MAG: lysophospholipid acyltransferase family protein [Acetobacteraceae bacterium]
MTLLRSALFNLFFYLVTILMVLFLATPMRLLVPRYALGVAQLWAHVMLWALRVICGVRVHVCGLQRIGTGAALVASQHQSAFDTLVWLALVPRCCYVMKQELVRIPLFGPLLPLAGMISVDRAGGASALRGLVREGVRAAGEGRQIVIFPEGTRAPAGTVLPLQPGVAALATRTGLPVIPVVTDSGQYWGRRSFTKRAGTIHIRVLEPIPAGLGRAQMMQRLEAALRSKAVENSVG